MSLKVIKLSNYLFSNHSPRTLFETLFIFYIASSSTLQVLHTCMYICMYIYTYIYIYMYVCIRIYAYI